MEKVTEKSINEEIAKYINLYHEMTAPLIKNIKQGDFVLGKLNKAKKIEVRPKESAWLNTQIKRVTTMRDMYKDRLNDIKNKMKF